jgi:hypothetical protein
MEEPPRRDPESAAHPMNARLACALAPLALAACRDGSDGPRTGGPDVSAFQNLELAAGLYAGDEELIALGVLEAGQGALRDRNGDGDDLDQIVHAYDPVARTTRNLGFALSPAFPGALQVSAGWIWMVGSEDAQGHEDKNLDGDAADEHLLVLVPGSDRPTRGPALALARIAPVVEGRLAAFAVSEADQHGADRTGDGDANDSVPCVFDPATGVVRSPGLAMGAALGFHDGWLAFTTAELELGLDLNGDGDASDAVLQFFEASTGRRVNSGLASALFAPIELGGEWLVLVDEAAQDLDLDLDGARESLVAHAFEPAAERVQSLALPCELRAPVPQPGGSRICFFAHEAPGVDRNGDGDSDDVTAVIHDAEMDRFFAPGLALEGSSPGVAWSGELLALDVSEAAQSEDLDGDGDRLDLVVHVVAPATGGVRNLELASHGVSATPELVLVPRFEGDAGLDWNGDEDHDDLVLFVWDLRDDQARPTGLAGTGGALGSLGPSLLVTVPEAADARDWNEDGDRKDLAFVLHQPSFERNVSFGGLVGAFPGDGRVLGSRFAVLVDEASAGEDLNSDGDVEDEVLFVWG